MATLDSDGVQMVVYQGEELKISLYVVDLEQDSTSKTQFEL